MWELPTIRVLYHLVLLQSAREPEAAFSTLAQRLALLGGHWTVRLRHGHATVLRAVGEARGIGRRTVARGWRVVRSRGRRPSACASGGEQRLAVAVLAHTAVAARTGCPYAGPVSKRCSSDAWFVTVRGDFGSREVRVAGMPDYPVRVEVAIEVVSATAVATPAKQTDKKDGDQTSNTANNAANNCSGITATTSGVGRRRRGDNDGRLDGGGNYLTIGSGRPVRESKRNGNVERMQHTRVQTYKQKSMCLREVRKSGSK